MVKVNNVDTRIFWKVIVSQILLQRWWANRTCREITINLRNYNEGWVGKVNLRFFFQKFKYPCIYSGSLGLCALSSVVKKCRDNDGVINGWNNKKIEWAEAAIQKVNCTFLVSIGLIKKVDIVIHLTEWDTFSI